MRLRELQNHLSRAIVGESLVDSAAILVRETPAFSRSQRLGVYQYAFRARVIDALADDFPITRNVLGENSFEEAAIDYVCKKPLGFASIAEISRGFPNFLKTIHSVAPSAFDIADYEWLLVDASNAWLSSKPALSVLVELTADEQAKAVLQLNPSVHLFESSWAVDSIEEDSRALPTEQLTHMAIYPAPSGARSERLSQVEWKALSVLREPTPIETLSQKLASLQLTPDEITRMFSTWSQKQFFVVVSVQKQKEERI